MTSARDPEIEGARRTLEALRGFDPSGAWEEVRPAVLPLLKRVRHPFPPDAEPMHLQVPPGIWTGFGIDIGPAWAHVSRGLFRGWGIDEATLLGTALENLRRRVLEEPPQVERATVAGTSMTVIQAQGWGSALVLAPDRLGADPGSRAADPPDAGPERPGRAAAGRRHRGRGARLGDVRRGAARTSSTSTRCRGTAAP